MTDQPQSKAKGVVDIVFLLDATGSMGPCIAALKTNIGLFIDSLTMSYEKRPAFTIAGLMSVQARFERYIFNGTIEQMVSKTDPVDDWIEVAAIVRASLSMFHKEYEMSSDAFLENLGAIDASLSKRLIFEFKAKHKHNLLAKMQGVMREMMETTE